MRGSLNNRTLANTPTEKANTSSSLYPAVEEENAGGAQASEWQDHLTGQSYITSRIPGAKESVCVLSQSLVFHSLRPHGR